MVSVCSVRIPALPLMFPLVFSDRALEVPLLPVSPQMPPKRDEAALQEEEELQLAIALSQSEAEEKERAVSLVISRLAVTRVFLKWNTKMERHAFLSFAEAEELLLGVSQSRAHPRDLLCAARQHAVLLPRGEAPRCTVPLHRDTAVRRSPVDVHTFLEEECILTEGLHHVMYI